MLAKVPLNDIKESIKHNLDENITKLENNDSHFLILLILFIIDSLIKNELIIFNFFRLLLFYDERYIAIGNWGCGVYNGIFELKFLEQWIAASFSGVQRNLYSDDLLAHQISSNAGCIMNSSPTGHEKLG